jgi:hypothetical protein
MIILLLYERPLINIILPDWCPVYRTFNTYINSLWVYNFHIHVKVMHIFTVLIKDD